MQVQRVSQEWKLVPLQMKDCVVPLSGGTLVSACVKGLKRHADQVFTKHFTSHSKSAQVYVMQVCNLM